MNAPSRILVVALATLVGPPYIPASSAPSVYEFTIIAQTGDESPQGGTLTSLGWGPSLNDSGKAAFSARTRDGRYHVLAGDSKASLQDRSALAQNFSVSGVSFNTRDFLVSDTVQINNRDQVVWTTQSPDGLFAFILRLGATTVDAKVVAKNRYVRLDNAPIRLDSPFDHFEVPSRALATCVTMNNCGRVVFSGTLAASTSLTVLATPRDILRGGTSVMDDYFRSGWFPDLPAFYPMISDDAQTVVRAGARPTDALIAFADETLANDVSGRIAGAPDFRAIGEKPGISDDGQVIGFMGDHVRHGPGIFGWKAGVVFQIANLNGTADAPFTSFSLRPRVGVSRSPGGSSADKYTFAFLATRQVGTSKPGELGPLGLYTVEADLANEAQPKLSPALCVLKVMDKIPELAGLVQDIAVYDPINNKGQLALWVNTSAGIHAVLRAAVKPADLKGFINFRDGTPIRRALVSLVNKEGVTCASTNSLDDGSYSIELKQITQPGDYYLKAQTVGSRASRIHTVGEMPTRDGEAVNWYSEGNADPVDWDRHKNPMARPDLTVRLAAGQVIPTGGDALEDYQQGSVDIYFPQPIVWVHGISAKASRFGPQYQFFSEPDHQHRYVAECSLSYFVDILKTTGLGNRSCLTNAELMDGYMKTVYDAGMAALVADWPRIKPKLNLVCHSMGAPISRVWECRYNGAREHGDVGYYLSISGIHGGNYAASFYTAHWRKPLSWLRGGWSAADCAVHRILALNEIYSDPHGTYRFAWGINGGPVGVPGFVNGLVWRELKPHDSVNNAPSATSQNGPYRRIIQGIPVVDWISIPDSNRDLRASKYGRHVQDTSRRMGSVDFASIGGEKELAERAEYGDHSFMDSGLGCMASYARWLELTPPPAIASLFQPTSEFATWPDNHEAPPSGRAPQSLSTEEAANEISLVASFDDELIRPGEGLRFKVIVDECNQARFQLLWNLDCDIRLSLESPAGDRIDPTLPPPGVIFQTAASTEDMNAHQTYALVRPTPGIWTMVVEPGAKVPLEGTRVLLNVAEESALVFLHTLSATELGRAEALTVQAVVATGQLPLVDDVAVQGMVIAPDGKSFPLHLHDDGADGDAVARDGLFTTRFEKTHLSGEYHLTLTSTGAGGDHRIFQRIGASTFQVRSAKASIEKVREERAMDTDASGAFDDLTAVLELSVTDPGKFLVSGRLVGVDGSMLDATTREVVLGAGTHTVGLTFEGARIGDGRRHGPYVIKDLNLFELVSPADSVDGGRGTYHLRCDPTDVEFSTRAYRFWEFDRAETGPGLLIHWPRHMAGPEVLLVGKAGLTYEIHASENLRDWTLEETIEAAAAPTVVVPGALSKQQRYFRAVLSTTRPVRRGL